LLLVTDGDGNGNGVTFPLAAPSGSVRLGSAEVTSFRTVNWPPLIHCWSAMVCWRPRWSPCSLSGTAVGPLGVEQFSLLVSGPGGLGAPASGFGARIARGRPGGGGRVVLGKLRAAV
jgi:hypothetical protein